MTVRELMAQLLNAPPDAWVILLKQDDEVKTLTVVDRDRVSYGSLNVELVVLR